MLAYRLNSNKITFVNTHVFKFLFNFSYKKVVSTDIKFSVINFLSSTLPIYLNNTNVTYK
jgi:hypothetical protein